MSGNPEKQLEVDVPTTSDGARIGRSLADVKAKVNKKLTKKTFECKVLLESKRCQGGCNKIPSPYQRFLCVKGHMLCWNCGKKRFENVDGTCMVQSLVKVERQEVGKCGDEEQWELKPEECQEKLKRYPADPVYCALYNHTIWRCPNGEGCEVRGEQLFENLVSCGELKESDM